VVSSPIRFLPFLLSLNTLAMSPSSSETLRSWLESNGTFIHPSLEIKQGELSSRFRRRSLPLSKARSSPSLPSLLSFPPDPIFGLSTWTTSSHPAETTVISLPFHLAVTPELAERSILALWGEGKDSSSWKEAVVSLEERVKVLVYLVLHWIGDDASSSLIESVHPDPVMVRKEDGEEGKQVELTLFAPSFSSTLRSALPRRICRITPTFAPSL